MNKIKIQQLINRVSEIEENYKSNHNKLNFKMNIIADNKLRVKNIDICILSCIKCNFKYIL